MSLLEHSFRNADRLTITPFDELSANGCHKVYVIQGIYVGIYVSRKALRADKSGRRLNCAEFRNDVFELSYATSPTSTGLVSVSGFRFTGVVVIVITLTSTSRVPNNVRVPTVSPPRK